MEQGKLIKRLLVVEDDINGQEITRKLLEHNDFVVDIAADGQDALKLLKEHVYSAVIIDLTLPGMSGWQLLQEIRTRIDDKPAQYWEKLPCFAVTAYHSRDVARKAIEAGFTNYYAKPINLMTFANDLKQRIN